MPPETAAPGEQYKYTQETTHQPQPLNSTFTCTYILQNSNN